MIDAKLLSKENQKEYCHLLETISTSIPNELFWLPISQTSAEHFFDPEWTDIIGLFDDEKLVAVSSLFYHIEEYGESAAKVGIDCTATKVAEIGRCAVLPTYRGRDIMYTLNKKLVQMAKNRDIQILIATAHPNNVPSCKSLEKLGMKLEGHIIKKKKYPRNIYIMHLN